MNPQRASISRRDVLRASSLVAGSLSLGNVLRMRAEGGSTDTRTKSVIMVHLLGGPSHIDMYDMRPEAPAEYRGDFLPTATSVPGMEICELMPRQAQIARGHVEHIRHA